MNTRQFIQHNKLSLVFISFLVFLFFAYRYPFSIQKGPISIHMWRQADCYSLTLNYLEEGHRFFQPAIHWSGEPGNGKTVSGFPVIYYLVSLIWHVTGKHYFIFRSLNLLIVFTGLFYLFKFIKEFLGDGFWAIYIPVLLFTSPVLVYYSNTFMMNAPALGFVLIGLYHYWKYYQLKKPGRLYAAMAFFLIAGLLKMTAFLLFAALLIAHISGLSGYLRTKLKIPSFGKSRHLVPYLIVILLTAIWIIWSQSYNHKNISGVFLRSIFPIWEISLYQGLELGTSLYTSLLPALFNHTATIILLGMFLWVIIKRKRAHRALLYITILVFAGMLVFVILFFQAFNVHDYYLINLLIFIPLVTAVFLDYLKNNRPGFFYSRPFRTLAGIALFLLLYKAVVIQRVKYDTGDTFVKHTVVLDQTEKGVWIYFENVHNSRYAALDSITPYLRELGIHRTDKVISIPDGSPNITLSLMDQKGFTDFGFNQFRGEERIQRFIELGARYLIINDPSVTGEAYLKPYLHRKIGQFRNVSVYRLPGRL